MHSKAGLICTFLSAALTEYFSDGYFSPSSTSRNIFSLRTELASPDMREDSCDLSAWRRFSDTPGNELPLSRAAIVLGETPLLWRSTHP